MLTDRELQSLRNIGNEGEAAADEIAALRAALQAIADFKGEPGQPVRNAVRMRGIARAALAPNAKVTRADGAEETR